MDERNILLNSNIEPANGCRKCKRKKRCLVGLVLMTLIIFSFVTVLCSLYLLKQEIAVVNEILMRPTMRTEWKDESTTETYESAVLWGVPLNELTSQRVELLDFQDKPMSRQQCIVS